MKKEDKPTKISLSEVFHTLFSMHTGCCLWEGMELGTTSKVKVKVAQLCPTPCDPIDYTVHGILQARILEWVAIPFSRASSQPRNQTQVSLTAGGFFTS